MSGPAGSLAAIVTAAGRSSRMGRPKALLDWGGRPLVRHQCEALAAAGFTEVVVVVGHRAGEIGAAVPAPARVVVAEGWESGRSASLEAAASAVPDGFDGVLIVAVDQPLEPAVLERLTAAFEAGAADVWQPVDADGRRGHPILLDGGLLAALRSVSELPVGLRTLVTAPERRVREVPVGAAHLRWDLNTPEAYASALERRLEGQRQGQQIALRARATDEHRADGAAAVVAPGGDGDRG